MDETGLMNRSRGLAEGVVVMVCPVLLALVMDKVDLKVYGRHNFMAMLSMAGVTLISGICPVLVCCFSERFPDVVNPTKATTSSLGLAALSSSCLLVLACFIAKLIVSKKILITVGTLCGTFVLVVSCSYYLGNNVVTYSSKIHERLDESHEFLTGVTGILFLGLEGLALESHDNQMFQKGSRAVGTTSFIVCALGVCLMYFEMNPPQHFMVETQIVGFTLVLDTLMAFGTFALLIVVMVKLMGIPALVLFTPLAVLIGELVYRVTVQGTEQSDPQNQVTPPPPPPPPPASLELTRVTFTGFLVVSVTTLDNTSPRVLTVCFLLFAAAAIVFGISWRLLTQSQIRSCLADNAVTDEQVASSAKLASLCTHFCVVIATTLFLAMAGTARGKNDAN